MAEEPQEPRYGLVVRLIANVITFVVFFGAFWPLAQWALGDSKGFKADLRDGLIQGAGVGVLMTFLGDPLVRWLDRILRRKKPDSPGP